VAGTEATAVLARAAVVAETEVAETAAASAGVEAAEDAEAAAGGVAGTEATVVVAWAAGAAETEVAETASASAVGCYGRAVHVGYAFDSSTRPSSSSPAPHAFCARDRR